MNILYIGSSGSLSLVPFKKLLSIDITIAAVGVFNPVVLSGKVIAIANESLALAANQNNIPLLDLSQPLELLLEQCQKFSIDVILMSCFNKRLPDAIINLAVKGCFNLHPSLLPQYRGPEPIFWQMKAASTLGVSWHKVVHDFDAGDVVATKKVIADDGSSYSEIQLLLAENGAELMVSLLKDLSSGELVSKPQILELASYYPYPQQKDFVVENKWTARHAYNFMRATRIFDIAYRNTLGKYCYLLKDALDFDNNANLETAEIQSDRLYIPCMVGVLITSYIDRIEI